MKLVTDGEQWAIKRGWRIFAGYYDFQTAGHWWAKDSKFFMDCWSTKKHAEQTFNRLTA